MELTNDIFGLQILAATFDIFLNIVITPYFLYLDLKTISSSEFVFMISKEGKVFWTISNILKLVFIFLPCAATTNEAKKTSFILCKLLNEDLQSGVKKELTTFLLQLLSSHKRMGFSASGMFELNLSSIISERFKILNRKLELIVRRVNSKSRVVTAAILVPTVETIRLSDVSEQQVTIAMMSDIHWMLCDMVEKVNDLFGAQLLAVMVCIFIHNIVTPYFFFLELMYPKGDSLLATIHLVSQFFWIITHILELLVIVLPCAATSNEANITSKIVCKLLNRNLTQATRQQLETFALQLTHHRAEFSAYGMFKLDLPVITSIAGAVTTYLVILIQFQSGDLGFEIDKP